MSEAGEKMEQEADEPVLPRARPGPKSKKRMLEAKVMLKRLEEGNKEKQAIPKLMPIPKEEKEEEDEVVLDCDEEHKQEQEEERMEEEEEEEEVEDELQLELGDGEKALEEESKASKEKEKENKEEPIRKRIKFDSEVETENGKEDPTQDATETTEEKKKENKKEENVDPNLIDRYFIKASDVRKRSSDWFFPAFSLFEELLARVDGILSREKPIMFRSIEYCTKQKTGDGKTVVAFSRAHPEVVGKFDAAINKISFGGYKFCLIHWDTSTTLRRRGEPRPEKRLPGAGAEAETEKPKPKPEEDPRYHVTIAIGSRSECIPDDKLMPVLMKQNKLPGVAKFVSCDKPDPEDSARKLVIYGNRELLTHFRNLPAKDQLLNLATTQVSFKLHKSAAPSSSSSSSIRERMGAPPRGRGGPGPLRTGGFRGGRNQIR